MVRPNPLSPGQLTMYSTSLTWCFHPRHNPKTYILNGYTYSMVRSCRVGGRTLETLCSGKHHKAGHNLQILTDQAGQIFYISPPLPGSTHNITAIRNTGLFGYMQPWHCTADIRICWFRVRHTFQKKTRKTPTRLAETIQQRNQPDPVCYRTIHSSSESMADPFYPL